MTSRRPDAAPVHLADYGALVEAVMVPRAPSLGQLVLWWTEALAAGAYSFEPGTAGWSDTGKAPQALVDAWL